MNEEVNTNVETTAVEKLENEIAQLAKDLDDTQKECSQAKKWWLEEREKAEELDKVVKAFKTLIKHGIIDFAKFD